MDGITFMDEILHSNKIHHMHAIIHMEESTQMNEYEIHESKLTTWMVKFPIWMKFNNMDESDFSFHIHKHPSHLRFSFFITPQQYVQLTIWMKN
jgi:hypothetical protein